MIHVISNDSKPMITLLYAELLKVHVCFYFFQNISADTKIAEMFSVKWKSLLDIFHFNYEQFGNCSIFSYEYLFIVKNYTICILEKFEEKKLEKK